MGGGGLLSKNPRSPDKFFLDFLSKAKKELVWPSAPFKKGATKNQWVYV